MNEPVNLAQKLALFDERFSPRIVATMNDYKIEVVEVEGEFVCTVIRRLTTSSSCSRVSSRRSADSSACT